MTYVYASAIKHLACANGGPDAQVRHWEGENCCNAVQIGLTERRMPEGIGSGRVLQAYAMGSKPTAGSMMQNHGAGRPLLLLPEKVPFQYLPL